MLELGHSRNEQYLVRALLMGSPVFEILFGRAYAGYIFRDLIETVTGEKLTGDDSLWLRKTRDY